MRNVTTWLALGVLTTALTTAGCGSDDSSDDNTNNDHTTTDAGTDHQAHPDAQDVDSGSDSASDTATDSDTDAPSDSSADTAPSCSFDLTNSTPKDVELGSALTISVAVPGADSVDVFVRTGDPNGPFVEHTMTGNGDSYSFDVPVTSMTFCGVDYYFVAHKGACEQQEPSVDPSSTPLHVDVWGLKRVTNTTDVYDYSPDVDGRYLVFSKDKAGGHEDNTFVFDLCTFEEKQLTHLKYMQGLPKIQGGLVTWTDHRNATSDPKNVDLYAMYLPGGAELPVTTAPSGQYGQEVYGRFIVWRDDRNMTGGKINGDIYLLDLGPDGKLGTTDDKGEVRLTSEPKDETAPDVFVRDDGRAMVVWSDERDDPSTSCNGLCRSSIYLIDSGPDGEFGTADDIGPQRVSPESTTADFGSPTIEGRFIAWRDTFREQGGFVDKHHLHLYDMGPDGLFGTADDVGYTKPTIAGQSEIDGLDISGQWLVYDDYRNKSYEIYAFDLTSNQEKTITNTKGGQFHPRISGRTIVWQDARNNPPADPEDDIYAYVMKPE